MYIYVHIYIYPNPFILWGKSIHCTTYIIYIYIYLLILRYLSPGDIYIYINTVYMHISMNHNVFTPYTVFSNSVGIRVT